MGEGMPITLKGIAENPSPLINAVGNVFPDTDEDLMRSAFRLNALHADVLRQMSEAPPFTDPAIQNHQIGDGSMEALQGFVLQTLQDPGQHDAYCPGHREDWDWEEPSLYPRMALSLFADVVRALYNRAIDAVREDFTSRAQVLVDAAFESTLEVHPWLIRHREMPKVTLQPMDSLGAEIIMESGGGSLGELLSRVSAGARSGHHGRP